MVGKLVCGKHTVNPMQTNQAFLNTVLKWEITLYLSRDVYLRTSALLQRHPASHSNTNSNLGPGCHNHLTVAVKGVESCHSHYPHGDFQCPSDVKGRCRRVVVSRCKHSGWVRDQVDKMGFLLFTPIKAKWGKIVISKLKLWKANKICTFKKIK